MIRLTVRAAAIIVASLALATTAGAQVQTVRLPQVGGSLGISIPAGPIAKNYAAGFNLSALAEYRMPGEALGIRGEVFYEHFPAKEGIAVDNRNTVALNANVLYHMVGNTLNPYVIAGMGFYHLSEEGNRPGLNAGMGIDIPLAGFSGHFEARVHVGLTDGPTYVSIPVSFGLRF